ncbi:MAG: SHOCT domain-containing protein [Bacteroidetes bacterium]|nr:SHOCT domain-containing protein [Bacteroidota bacterium]
MMHGFNGMGFGMGWGWIIGLIILVAVIWVIVKASNQNSHTNQSGNKTFLDLLKERYARGEIDKEEFEEKKRNLSS